MGKFRVRLQERSRQLKLRIAVSRDRVARLMLDLGR